MIEPEIRKGSYIEGGAQASRASVRSACRDFPRRRALVRHLSVTPFYVGKSIATLLFGRRVGPLVRLRSQTRQTELDRGSGWLPVAAGVPR
jgi:hypothetical protein